MKRLWACLYTNAPQPPEYRTYWWCMKMQCRPDELPPARTLLLWEKIMTIEAKVRAKKQG